MLHVKAFEGLDLELQDPNEGFVVYHHPQDAAIAGKRQRTFESDDILPGAGDFIQGLDDDDERDPKRSRMQALWTGEEVLSSFLPTTLP